MNDITALAQSMKAAAKDEIAQRLNGDTSDLWQDEASPENILVLVGGMEEARHEHMALGIEKFAYLLDVAAGGEHPYSPLARKVASQFRNGELE